MIYIKSGYGQMHIWQGVRQTVLVIVYNICECTLCQQEVSENVNVTMLTLYTGLAM